MEPALRELWAESRDLLGLPSSSLDAAASSAAVPRIDLPRRRSRSSATTSPRAACSSSPPRSPATGPPPPTSRRLLPISNLSGGCASFASSRALMMQAVYMALLCNIMNHIINLR
ncbi:unnamed protein product [Miscanthus lutarioriparius]|uniref:Uncharacterized protein n=1 Tax=Miscanthus lutarioriparius TaxID=422564 RepID=A0A811NLK7_9POAL|nr:unnamed protein product [Miscanthus lutarioriparius]